MSYQTVLLSVAGFAVIALASKQIGQFFVRFRLPLISGFLFAGIVAGPFGLGLIPAEAIEDLRFVDEISLAIIAFIAGSELYLQELRDRLKSIIAVTTGNAIVIPILGSLMVLLLANFIPFMQAMPLANRIAVSLLAGAILVARSPSSVVAVVTEMRARGPFTQTVLGVTMLIDVVVIFLFAFSSSVADILLTSSGFSLGFLVLLVAELPLSLAVGYGLGKILQFILARRFNSIVKTGLVLLTGYAVFALTEFVREIMHDRLTFEIFLEPLLICMVGSILVVNFSNYRTEFLKTLQSIAPPIYIVFFTLTGASLALDVLVSLWPIALALFAVRLVGIFGGSFSGGIYAGDPMKHNRLSWLAYVTQAGIGLGLAKEVAVEFPEWGAAFATLMIAVIVLNQLTGPPLFKWAIEMIGEAHTRAETPEFDGVRDAIIFGLEGQALALARQLYNHGWKVKLAAREASYRPEMINSDFDVYPISSLSLEELYTLEADKAEALVMLLSDEENYRLCELAYEHLGTENLIVRLNDRANFGRFHDLGALIVDPTTAIVSLLDHLVRSPTAASLLLGTDEDQDIIDLEVCNPNLHGVALRDLRLPIDTLILSVHRNGRGLISHGYTRLKIGDRVTIVGSTDSLEEVMLRFDPCS